MGRDGPVVIDWTMAARGDPSVDVAVTWTLIASGEVPAGRVQAIVLGIGRKLLLSRFLGSLPDEEPARYLRPVIEWKCRDTNMSGTEIRRMHELVEDHRE